MAQPAPHSWRQWCVVLLTVGSGLCRHFNTSIYCYIVTLMWIVHTFLEWECIVVHALATYLCKAVSIQSAIIDTWYNHSNNRRERSELNYHQHFLPKLDILVARHFSIVIVSDYGWEWQLWCKHYLNFMSYSL